MFEGSVDRTEELRATGFDFIVSVMGARTQYVDWFASATSHTGNSVLRENSAHFAALAPTRVVMRTVDDLLVAGGFGSNAAGAPLLPGRALLKLDVQGYEIEVLRGAARAIECADMILLETTVLPYNKAAPLMIETLAYVGKLGFDVLDLVETHHAGPTAQLVQIDFTLVRRSHPLFAAAVAAANIVER